MSLLVRKGPDPSKPKVIISYLCQICGPLYSQEEMYIHELIDKTDMSHWIKATAYERKVYPDYRETSMFPHVTNDYGPHERTFGGSLLDD